MRNDEIDEWRQNEGDRGDEWKTHAQNAEMNRTDVEFEAIICLIGLDLGNVE